ncbi:MAG TPA: hypothetical protein VGR00_10810, partial [Thermoanaerobaculia bacterium]|nr:hypothetical protein [Thermoanaerobaculia bacterium]
MRLRTSLVLLVAGVALLFVLVPFFSVAQPHGLSITRRDAIRIADEEVRKLGVPVEKTWRIVRWDQSDHLEKEKAKDAAWRKKAEGDPAVGPRLGFFLVSYFRRAPAEKWPAYAAVYVGTHGEVLMAQRYLRNEEGKGNPTAESLRPRADALVASRAFTGAPNPVFDSVRPTVVGKRTDHVFRYRVASSVDTGPLDLFLGVHFAGDETTGFSIFEEYRDGRRFRFESGEQIAALFFRIAAIFVLLGILLAVFIKKYHAGELGVRTSALLFGATLVLSLLHCFVTAPSESYGTNFGALDALRTAVANGGFEFLFYFFPVCLLVFLAWAAGESRARERWGEKLASFDAIARRDPINATVGASVLTGLLAAPSLAALAFLLSLVPVALGAAHVETGGGTEEILSALGGPWGCLGVV